jgi:6-phosphogluconolactonase
LLALAAGCVPRVGPPSAATAPSGPRPPTFVYIGTAAGEILGFTLDGARLLAARPAVSGGRGPVFLASGRGPFLYAASAAGEVAAFAVRRTGALGLLGRVSAHGSGTSAATLHRSGKYLFAANSGTGTVAVLPVKPDGSLAAAEVTPVSAVPHVVTPHPVADVLCVVDAASARVTQFTFSTGTGVLTPSREPPLALPPDSAASHLAFHPGGKFAYLLEDGLAVIAAYTFEPISATLTVLAFQTIALAEGAAPVAARPARRHGRGNRGAVTGSGDLAVAPSGRFLYAVDGTHAQVAIFAVDGEMGGLTLVSRADSHGHRPITLALADHGQVLLVAHQGSPGVSTFFVDPQGGGITHDGSVTLPAAPVSVQVVTPGEGI